MMTAEVAVAAGVFLSGVGALSSWKNWRGVNKAVNNVGKDDPTMRSLIVETHAQVRIIEERSERTAEQVALLGEQFVTHLQRGHS